MKNYTYRLCMILINGNRIDGLENKLDVYLANNRLTGEEYTELMGMLLKSTDTNMTPIEQPKLEQPVEDTEILK